MEQWICNGPGRNCAPGSPCVAADLVSAAAPQRPLLPHPRTVWVPGEASGCPWLRQVIAQESCSPAVPSTGVSENNEKKNGIFFSFQVFCLQAWKLPGEREHGSPGWGPRLGMLRLCENRALGVHTAVLATQIKVRSVLPAVN